MNKLPIIAIFFTFLSFQSFAQLSKEEEKQLKSELKSLTPAEYSKLKEDLAASKEEASAKKAEVDALKQDNNKLKSENAQLQTEVADYKAAAQASVKEKQKEIPVAGDGDDYDNFKSEGASGVVFKVQIGAFKGFDIRKYFGNNKNFSGETEDGLMKYSLGVFKDYWEAEQFKKYLREMGVKGAWIVSYKNGKRVPIKDVLEGAL